ncbi:ADP-ribosyltransferase exoenzyme [Prevotella sp. tc2-28]|uniref:ADP-ribosyltransferase n=1 Tax=Prevotella sp. tc2-28 TaxID=1761888 RepID=UPI00089B6CDF|nr:ADP-ribosyltransferase [Prevotella sp. tc2-28]SEA80286.1 ADP-ribosyltransferase exoenzyme [Prevotella sp. tc2-28]
MTNEQKRKQLTAMFGAYSKRLETLYDKFIDRLTVIAHKSGVGVEDFLEKNVLYRFGNYPELREELNEIFSDYVQKDMLAYRAGITDGVALAYSHDNAVLSGFSILSNKAISQARNTAAETFIRNRLKTSEGLNLSQLVWNYCSQTKAEFEMAVSNVLADGLKKGTSAASLGLQVRQYLNNPDMMYRRYHRTVVDAQGNKKDVVKWRRRIVDENGKVRFVEEPLEKVGMGHYRSSKRNADRLMRTEINGAYHRANAERWQMEPFVIGIVIDLSPQHPAPDECDELAGRYPKDFIFTGWHPQCLCMSNPITIQGEEKKEFYRRLAAGEDMSGYVSPNAVKDLPDRAKQWIDANRDKFISAGERGKLGWIWRDNMKYVGKQFSPEELLKMGYQPSIARVKRVKTEAEKADIQRRWDERKAKNALIIKTGKNVWQVADKLEYTETIGMKSMLRNAIIKGDTIATREYSRALAKEIARINKEAALIEKTVPDAREWLKQFSLSDIKEVEKVVSNNVAKWSGNYATNSYLKSKYASLEEYLLSKLNSEALYVVDSTYLKPHNLYPTSKVAESAYLKLIKETQSIIDWQKIESALTELKAFDTKSVPFNNILSDIESAVSSKSDLNAAQELLSKAEAKKKQIEYDRGYAKKGKGISEIFSEERKKAAVWDTGNGQLADDTLFPTASKAWQAATKMEREKIYEYTHHYCDKNEPLQGRRYVGSQSRTNFETKVNLITRYIERNPLPKDMWFMRGDRDISVIRSRIEFAGGKWPNKIEDLVGMTMQEGGFMSTGSRRSSGFSSNEVVINIFAPKGTKAAYVEPFSQFGEGAQSVKWDGVTRYKRFSREDETLFQRGTKMRITKVYNDGYKTYIDVEIVGQEIKDLSYVLDSNIGY